MKNKENIEQLFKETFEHFEADVNPNVWANVQNGINASSGSAAGTTAKLAVGKIVAGVAAVVVVAGSILYFISGNNDPKIKSTSANNNSVQTQIPSEKTAQNIISESQSSNSLSNSQANKQTASVIVPEKQKSGDVSQNSEPTNIASQNEVTEDKSSGEHSGESPVMHKYGRATQGDAGMIRGNNAAYSLYSNSATDASSVDSHEEDAVQPTVNIFVSTTSGDAPLTVDFINQGIASSLNWDFGDGSSSRESSPSHTFDKAGTYVVTLNAKNPFGSVSDKVTIEVKSISEITDIPNIFTPNGDGENDLFFFKMKNIASVGVVIFSQKNGMVCEWNSPDGSWNGKLKNGEDAPEGVYFYTIQANGTDGTPHSEKGTVTLKRR